MQGFKNPTQPSQLQYQMVKFVDLRDGVNGRPAAPAGYPYQNSTLYPATPAVRSSGAGVDYSLFFSPAFANLYGYPDPAQPGRSLTLCELVDRGTVHELWVVGSGDVPDAGFAEVLEAKQRYTPAGAKIAGSFERCAGNGCFDTTVPICGRSVRIGFINVTRGPGCFIHSLGHGMESALGGTRSPWVGHDSISRRSRLVRAVRLARPRHQVRPAVPEPHRRCTAPTTRASEGSARAIRRRPRFAHQARHDRSTRVRMTPLRQRSLRARLPRASTTSLRRRPADRPLRSGHHHVGPRTSCVGYGRHQAPGGADLRSRSSAASSGRPVRRARRGLRRLVPGLVEQQCRCSARVRPSPTARA